MVTSHMSSPLERFTALFSPPRPIHETNAPNSEDEDHHKNSTKIGISPRCQFTFSDGRQCSLPAKVYPPPRKGYQQDALFAGNEVELSPVKEVQQAQFCVHHSSREEREGRGNDFPDAALVGLCADLPTPTNLNPPPPHPFLLLPQPPSP